MRIGLLLSESSKPDTLTALREQIESAAADGFSSAWLTNVFGLDALTALAVAGSGSGSGEPGIELGTAVVPSYPRHPAAMAQQARTTDLAVGGRLTLGLGLSHKMVIDDMYGYDFGKPARHMREYLSVLTPLLDGRPADFRGETLRANIALSTPNPGRVPVVLAALAPRMLELAGRMCDGTVLWMTGPKTIAEHIAPSIGAAARAAGRAEPRIVCCLPICVTDDPDAARAKAAEVFAMYGHLPSYRAMMDREGVEGPGDLALVGDEKAVAAQVERLAEAGVTDFVAGQYTRGDDAARTRVFLNSLVAG